MAKIEQEKKVIYSTKVNINLGVLRQVVEDARQESLRLGGKPKSQKDGTPAQRSAFHSFNTMNKFLERVDNGKDHVVIDVDGTVSGNSLRIYHNPSITSLSKSFRKCIEPIDSSDISIFTDVKAAEFALNCYFAGELEAIEAYRRGEDIYMHYAHLFPVGTPRDVVKVCLIGNLYGLSAYRAGLQCGISEGRADLMLRRVAQGMPKVEALKKKILFWTKTHGCYVCPSSITQDFSLMKVADFKMEKTGRVEMNPLLALSAFTQSALGHFVQGISKDLSSRTKTYLTVFDSFYCTIKPENSERFKEYLTKKLYPLIPGEFKTGKTFYEVYAKDATPEK